MTTTIREKEDAMNSAKNQKGSALVVVLILIIIDLKPYKEYYTL